MDISALSRSIVINFFGAPFRRILDLLLKCVCFADQHLTALSADKNGCNLLDESFLPEPCIHGSGSS